jgi:hypothetical protein
LDHPDGALGDLIAIRHSLYVDHHLLRRRHHLDNYGDLKFQLRLHPRQYQLGEHLERSDGFWAHTDFVPFWHRLPVNHHLLLRGRKQLV